MKIKIEKDEKNGFLLSNGEFVKDGDKIRAIENKKSIYEVRYIGVYIFATYEGDFPAEYKLEDYKDKLKYINNLQ